MFTVRGNSVYDGAKVFCTMPTSTNAARKAEIAANLKRVMALPMLEDANGQLLLSYTAIAEELSAEIKMTAALKAEIAALKAPPVVVFTPAPPPVVVPPPVTTPPIIAGQVASLQAATDALRAGNSIKLKPGVYVGQLDLQYISRTVTLDATGVELTGAVRLQDTKGVTVQGLAVKGQIYAMGGCENITFNGCSVTGSHKGLGTAGYQNTNGFDFGLGIGNLSILNCRIQDVLCGAVIVANGDLRIEDTEIFRFGDDGLKIAFNSQTARKDILRNTIGIPLETGAEYHSDMIQLTAIGADSAIPYDNLRVEENVMFENHDLSEAAAQGFCSFYDGSPAGRQFRNASVKGNKIMVSNGHGLTLVNVNGGEFTGNTVIGARMTQPNTPWVSLGQGRLAGIVRNENFTPAKVFYPTVFTWDGIEQPKTRADVLRILTRR